MNLSRKPRLALHILATCSLLSACATSPAPRIVYQQVPVEVAGHCIPKELPGLPSDATIPESLAALADGPTRYARLAAAYLTLYGWSLQAAPVIVACR
jgi:hypothetical protein